MVGFRFSASGIVNVEWELEWIDAVTLGPAWSLHPNARAQYGGWKMRKKRAVHLSKFRREGKLLASSSSTIAVTRRRG